TTPTDVNVRFDAAAKQYLLVVNVDLNATIGNPIGLEITNPSTDITFRDALPDPGTYLSGAYEQTGYITTTSVSWTTNTFTVTPAPDLNPPQVLATTPAVGATDIEPDTLIKIVFSQYMLEQATGGGVLNPANYELRDIVNDTTITVTPTYNSSAQTLTLTPDSTLDWAITYRVTLDQTIEDVDGQTLFDQYAADYPFTFVTRPEFPEVNEPTAIKNRIGTGANSETVILIPTPPKGDGERISVQVFTTTGRLVKTFCKNVPYSTITDGRYIWDGTNDRGQDLGPGMYFVQVRTESYKRVLKVMIVR
ncbi:MAG: Ig-like domain-containing protein, partial [Spirochaetia bacterium]